MGIIGWLIFGAIVGWIASKIMGTDAQQGALLNIIVGIVGALLGGFLWRLLTGDNGPFEFFDDDAADPGTFGLSMILVGGVEPEEQTAAIDDARERFLATLGIAVLVYNGTAFRSVETLSRERFGGLVAAAT